MRITKKACACNGSTDPLLCLVGLAEAAGKLRSMLLAASNAKSGGPQ